MSRLGVFVRTWGAVVTRSLGGATVIGAAIGLVGAVVGVADGRAEHVLLVPLAALVAGVVGVLFGLAYGLGAAVLWALALYPYPGRWSVQAWAKVTGVGAGVVLDAMALAEGGGAVDGPAALLLLVPPALGLLFGVHLMDWYVREAEVPRHVPTA